MISGVSGGLDSGSGGGLAARPQPQRPGLSAAAVCSYANLLRSLATCSRNKMPLLRDAADSSLRRAHPSLMIGDGGPSPGRLAVWLINISAAHHYHHHCCFPVT